MATALTGSVAGAEDRSLTSQAHGRLVRALASDRQGEIDRAGLLASPAAVLIALNARDPTLVDAAVAAAPATHQNWTLLPRLIQLMHTRNHTSAVAAARATRRIAEHLGADDLLLHDHPPSLLAAPARGLLRVATDSELATDIRTAAILALADIAHLAGMPRNALLALLTDREPGIRASAVELFAAAPTPSASRALARLVAADPSDRAARAAATALCAHVVTSARAAVLEALQQAGSWERIRHVAEDEAASADELVDLAACLKRAAGPTNRRAHRRILRRLRRAHLSRS